MDSSGTLASNDGGVAASLKMDSLTSSAVNTGNEWQQFFGPANLATNSSPYDKYAYSTYDLPEAYVGKNFYIRDTIEGLISGDTSQHTWYTSPACLPYQQTDQIHLTWNVWQFNRTLAGQVPHQGISRLITSSKRNFKDHTVRHGLAFYLEHGFMKTAEGRQQYQRNLLGIRQCVQETNNYDVMSALLHSNRYDREYEIKHGQYNKPTAEVLRREVDEWASVQKSGFGLDWVTEEYKEHMMRVGGVTPSTMIIPSKMAMHLTMTDPVKTQYLYAGEGGVKMLRDGPAPLTSYRGVSVFKAHSFDVYEGELPIDLLSRDMQIGEFYCMKDTTNDKRKYTTSQRDIVVYDESTDGWSRIGFKQAMKKCTRFNDDGSLADGPGSDMFTVGKSGVNVEIFGEIARKFLPDSELAKMAETMSVDEGLGLTAADKKALVEGMALVNTWEQVGVPLGANGAPYNVASLTPLKQWNQNGHDFQYPQGADIPSNYGGCTNWVMLRLIAQSGTDVDIKTKISDLLAAVEKLYDLTDTAYPENKVSDFKEYGHDYLMAFLPDDRQKTLCTFFENAIGHHYKNLWVGDNAASASNQVNGIDTSTIDLSGKDPRDKKKTSKTLLDFLKEATNEDEGELKASIAYVFQAGSSSSFKKPSDLKNLELNAARLLVSEIKKIQEQNRPAVATSGNVFVTPFSSTPGMGLDISSSPFTFPNITGYSFGNQTRFSTDPLLIASKAKHRMSHSGIMSHYANSEAPMFRRSNKRYAPNDGAVDWDDSRKRMRQNTSIDDFMDDALGDDISYDYEFSGAPAGRNVGLARLNSNGEFARSYEGASHENDLVKRAIMRTFLFTPVNRGVIEAMMEANVYVPFAILLARPFMTYSMSSAVLMKGGYDTGATYVGHSDFQLGDDVASKVHYGNFTYYSKAIVHEPRNVIIMENVMSNRYLYGNGSKFWTKDDLDKINEVHADTVGVKQKGLISMIVPNTHALTETNPISLTGKFARDNVAEGSMHFVGASWYAMNLGLKDSTDVDDQEIVAYDQSHREYNSVCWRGHSYSYNSGTKGFTTVTRNSGHWGPNVYPGCGRVRGGAGSTFEQQNYSSAPV